MQYQELIYITSYASVILGEGQLGAADWAPPIGRQRLGDIRLGAGRLGAAPHLGRLGAAPQFGHNWARRPSLDTIFFLFEIFLSPKAVIY